MSEQIKQLYALIKKDRKNNSIVKIAFVFIAVVFITIGAIGFANGDDGMMMVFVGVAILVGLMFSLLIGISYSVYLKKSLETLERTGAIKYIDEVLKREYVMVGKTAFSEHLLYVPGVCVIAFEDVVNLFRDNLYEFIIETIDGKIHRVPTSKEAMLTLKMKDDRILIKGKGNVDECNARIERFRTTGRKD